MSYLTRLTQHLQAKGLLNKEVEDAIKEFRELNRSDKEKISIDCFKFGKYKGKSIEEVCQFDKPYCKWILKQNWCQENLREKLNQLM